MNSPDPENANEVPADDHAAAPETLLVPLSEASRVESPELDALPQISPPSQSRTLRDFGSPLTWADIGYLLVFYLVAGYGLTLSVAAAAAAYSHSTTGDVLNRLDGPDASLAVVIQALLSFATLGFLYVLVRVRTGAPFWPAVGWRKFPGMTSWSAVATRYAFLGCGLAVLVSFASNLVDNGKTLPIEEFFHNRQTVLLLIVLGVLVAPFVEETLFRGCIYPVVAGRFGVPAGVIVTGVLFGLAHAPQLRGGEGQIALLVCVGIVLTYIRARAGTVLASYFVHVAYNSSLFAALIFSTGGLRHLPTT
jgi:membrane protease YdiL (CAAX protease family)